MNEIKTINSTEKRTGQPSLSLTALLEIECVGSEWLTLLVFFFSFLFSLFLFVLFFCFFSFSFLLSSFFFVHCPFVKDLVGALWASCRVLCERTCFGMMICARSFTWFVDRLFVVNPPSIFIPNNPYQPCRIVNIFWFGWYFFLFEFGFW